MRDEIELLGIEIATGQPAVWRGFHSIDWKARMCDTGCSRRIAEKLSFTLEGIQQAANLLPGGRMKDRLCYARFDRADLPPLDVEWG